MATESDPNVFKTTISGTGQCSRSRDAAGSVPWLRLLYNRELRAGHFRIDTTYIEWLEERLGSILHEQEMLFLHTRCPKNHRFVKKQWEAGEHVHLLQNTKDSHERSEL